MQVDGFVRTNRNTDHLPIDDKRNFRLCLHWENNSFLLFKLLLSLECLRISAFSAKHRAQIRSPGLYDFNLRTMDHLMLQSAPLLLSCQIQVERLVASLYFSWVNDVLCAENLCLKKLAVKPIQNLVSWTDPLAVTSARQTIESVRHLLSMGQLFLSLQLHMIRGGSWLSLNSFRTL